MSAQDTPTNDHVKIEVMQIKIDNLQRQIDDNKQHNKELQDANKDEVEVLMQQKEDALDSRMLIYVSIFIVAFVSTLGLFRWLGKSEIRKIVNDQAAKEIDEQLKIKLSNSIIDEKLTSLGKPLIEEMLKEITESKLKAKESAEELEESNKLYKQLLNELSSKKPEIDPSESTLEEKAKVKEFTEVLDKVKEANEFTQKDWYLKGKEEYNKREFDTAIKYFDESIKLKPIGLDAHYAYYYRGLSKFSLGQYEEAIVDFDIADKFQVKSYVSYIRASAYEALRDFPKALENIETSIRLDPIQGAKGIRERIIKSMNKK